MTRRMSGETNTEIELDDVAITVSIARGDES
jgi:hypothetical protein